MKRTPEPCELMDESEQAQAYAEANFGESNALFIHLLHQIHPQALSGRAIDLGCGPADIPLALVREHPELYVDAVDGSETMLALAEAKTAHHPALSERLNFHQHYLPSAFLDQGEYQFVLSNSLLHHLADPDDLWMSIRHCAADNAAVLVMDLARPSSPLAVDSLVETYAMNEPEPLREDFRNSLHAAYTPEEVAKQLAKHGLKELELSMVNDRHWAARGSISAKH